MNKSTVLVVGAGPAGLTAANGLVRAGIPTRIVDTADGPSELSRALAIWPRTLEVLTEYDPARHLEAAALPVRRFSYRTETRTIVDLNFPPALASTVIVQPDVEHALRLGLQDGGGSIEWGTELTDMEVLPDGRVGVTLSGPSGTERAVFDYVVGADGARSRVRKFCGIDFVGSTYPTNFVLADCELVGDDLDSSTSFYFCTAGGVLVLVPLATGRFRVFTACPPDITEADLDRTVLQRLVDDRGPGGIRITAMSWAAVFRIHARHAERFAQGRSVFLLGDAAHIHSPAGGQGLNTAVTDAHNLAWKIAMAATGEVDPSILDTYQSERRSVAESVVRQATVQTRAWMLANPVQTLARDVAVRTASRLGLLDSLYYPWMAGLRNRYPVSELVTPPRGPLRALRSGPLRRFRSGDLAPDLPVSGSSAAAPVPLRRALNPRCFTVMVVDGANRPTWPFAGDVDGFVHQVEFVHLNTRTLRLASMAHADASNRGPSATRSSVVIVRPDGYVACVDRSPGGSTALAYLRRVLTRVADTRVYSPNEESASSAGATDSSSRSPKWCATGDDKTLMSPKAL